MKIFTLQFNVNIFQKGQKVQQFVDGQKQDDELFKAPDYCMNNIMNFARSYKVTESQSTGKIEMMLN
jgi:hypothetical protein